MNRVKITLVAAISIALALTFSSCAGNMRNSASVATETFEDSRDGKKYKYVKIGEQTWMAENLNFNASGSVCYDNENRNCGLYGKLYNWEAAIKACPGGWHLPSGEEWDVLIAAIGDSTTAGKHLKAKYSWDNKQDGKSGNGLDTYGFEARAGGYGDVDGNFGHIRTGSAWWSASDEDADSVHGRAILNLTDSIYLLNFLKSRHVKSVRCVKD
jgi:uncharacterized protein (TIGR02145 family)